MRKIYTGYVIKLSSFADRLFRKCFFFAFIKNELRHSLGRKDAFYAWSRNYF